ncbi:unnamed protein product [Arabidopsis thaliana]|uniref:(thale cress) hypothetical protein n=1 Tax=Arabidopsis thaliana TaxID=3702 RepID=A0A7G2DYJ3_ARATH|nr:unnamed protein product [Arabidopsis thaliana]
MDSRGNWNDEGPPEHEWNEIFFIENVEGDKLTCRLPKAYANDFFDNWRHCGDKIIICVMRFAKLEVDQEDWRATTVHDCTRVLLNPRCAEVSRIESVFAEAEDEFPWEINPALDQYKIKVRVVRLWRLFKSIEMVLVDGEGTRVHASIEEGLDVLGQIVDVGSLDSIKAKGKDTVKLSAGSEDLIHVDSKNKTSHSAVTLYEEFFQLNEKKTVEDIVYACDVSTCVTIARVCFIETMPKCCGVCDADATDVSYSVVYLLIMMSLDLYRYKLILRASYGASPEVKLLFFDGLAQCLIGKTAAEFFAEVPKELTVVSDSACDIINPKIEMIESSVVDDSPSTDKRIFDDVKSKPVTGKKMVTRKKAKVEKLT